MSSIAAYVVNFQDLVSDLNFQIDDVALDTSGIEDLLNTYFPKIIGLLEAINRGINTEGTTQIRGFKSTGSVATFIPEKNILLTGITVSQSEFDGGCDDKWDVLIENEGETFYILRDMYSKDTLQHKYFDKYFPVPAGYTLAAQPTGINKTFWIDFEYLELD